MNITTNLPGRLRNTSLPRSHGLLPVFEAVVNSVHAIEEAQVSSEDGRIRVMIERAPAQQQLTVDDKPTKPEQSQGAILSRSLSQTTESGSTTKTLKHS